MKAHTPCNINKISVGIQFEPTNSFLYLAHIEDVCDEDKDVVVELEEGEDEGNDLKRPNNCHHQEESQVDQHFVHLL